LKELRGRRDRATPFWWGSEGGQATLRFGTTRARKGGGGSGVMRETTRVGRSWAEKAKASWADAEKSNEKETGYKNCLGQKGNCVADLIWNLKQGF
jgi:hypothetical protein